MVSIGITCLHGDCLQDSDGWVEAPPLTGGVDKAWKVSDQAQTASGLTDSAQVSCLCARVWCECVYYVVKVCVREGMRESECESVR